MSVNPDFDDIPIENYKQELFPEFILVDGVYATCSLYYVYVEVVYKIQCYPSTRKIQFHKKRNTREYWEPLLSLSPVTVTI